MGMTYILTLRLRYRLRCRIGRLATDHGLFGKVQRGEVSGMGGMMKDVKVLEMREG